MTGGQVGDDKRKEIPGQARDDENGARDDENKMRYRVYRNLDRPFTFLGVRGRYIPVALVGLLGIIVVAVVLGAALGTFTGLALAAALIVGGYIGLLEVQQRYGEKGLSRFLAGRRLPKFILVRSKVWKR